MSIHFQQSFAQRVDRPGTARLAARQVNGQIVTVGRQEHLAAAQVERQGLRDVVQPHDQLADLRLRTPAAGLTSVAVQTTVSSRSASAQQPCHASGPSLTSQTSARNTSPAA